MHPKIPARPLTRFLAALFLTSAPLLAMPPGSAPGALKEVPLPTGGYSVLLDGRFDRAPVASVESDGSVVVRCLEAGSIERSTPFSAQSVPPSGGPRSSVVVTAAGGLTIEIVNANAPGVGFNDPTPAAPVGGNAGTTLGAQRLNAFQYAASLWAPRLSSVAKITVKATFESLACSSNLAVLGAAGTLQVFRDFPTAPRPGTWYPSALAGKLIGTDPDPSVDDIQARFTTSLDGGSCSFPRRWYYGLDGSPTGTDIDLVTVVQHELGHGLGFQTFVDLFVSTTGTPPTGGKLIGYDDAFMVYLLDATTGKAWPDMTNAERLASETNTGNLLWAGPAVTAKAPGVLMAGIGAGGKVKMYAPNPAETGSSVSHWDTSLSPNELLEPNYTGPNHTVLLTGELLGDIGWSGSAPGPQNVWILPSSAHLGGQGGSFYTTDLTLANRTASDTTFTLKFLGHDVDGRTGAEQTFWLGAGRAAVYGDVLASVFNVSSGYGAIRISSPAASLNILGQTSTPGTCAGGTFGQSVPAAAPGDLVTAASSRSIVAIREDASFRTNLILANATESPLVVDIALYGGAGAFLGAGSYALPPLGMTQVTQVVRDLNLPFDVVNGQLVLSTPTHGGAFAAYAAVIDKATNDPRTLLPR